MKALLTNTITGIIQEVEIYSKEVYLCNEIRTISIESFNSRIEKGTFKIN